MDSEVSKVETDPIDEVKSWILSRTTEYSVIDEDLNLIENRVVDSLAFLELVMLLEELTGKNIAVENLTLTMFSTLRAIREHFFAS